MNRWIKVLIALLVMIVGAMIWAGISDVCNWPRIGFWHLFCLGVYFSTCSKAMGWAGKR